MRQHFHSKKSVLLLGGGQINEAVVAQLAAHTTIIAADGGGNYADAHGLDVRWVLGDGDSLARSSPYRLDGRFTPIIDQNSTDFNKALSAIDAPLIIGVGFLEDRFDHALAALTTLSQTNQTVVLVGASEALTVVRQREFLLHLPSATRLSIWPMQRIQFGNSQGLLYPLDGLELQPDARVGTSNQTNAEHVRITANTSLKAGYVLMVPSSHYLALCRGLMPGLDLLCAPD